MMNPIAWPEAQRICDIPEVRELIDAFAGDSHEENMLAMVSAIMGHASTQGRAAGLKEAAKRIWVERVAAADNNDLRMYEFLTALSKTIRALSPTPSDAGKVRAYGIYRTNPEENEGKEFFYYAMWHNDTVPGNGERIVPGYFTPDAALSSLEVIGKGENG